MYLYFYLFRMISPILPENELGLDENVLQNILYKRIQRIIASACFGALMCYFCKTAPSYNKTSFCLSALICVITGYRASLDAHGSVLLLCMLLVSILVTFYTKSFVLTVIFITWFSYRVDVFYLIVKYIVLKSFTDFMIARFNPIEVASKLTDIAFSSLFLIMNVVFSMKPMWHTSIEDLLLIMISMVYLAAFCLECFSNKQLCFYIGLALLWIYLKFKRFRPVSNLLYCTLYIIDNN